MNAKHPLYDEVRQQHEMLWGKNSKMIDFCVKEAQEAVKLTDGSIITIEKPSIKKDFCFGWNTFDDDSYDDANHMAYSYAKKKEYFIEKNLSGLEERIKTINDCEYDMYIYDSYKPQLKLKHYVFLRFSDELWKFPNAKKSANEAEDRKRILEALEKIKADFTKRLETWWKRYGEEYIHTWTYCRDD